MPSVFELPCLVQALLATMMTYAFTFAGSALVLLFRQERQSLMDGMMAFGAGIMLASAFWSLLDPGIAMASSNGQIAWLVCALGFLFGGVFLLLGDRIYEHFLCKHETNDSKRRCRLLIVSITLHNIPEGLAVGVAFGALASGMTPALLNGAWMLALGIAIQNFPEGAAVSLPLLREGCTPKRAFCYGQLSGLVEPIAGILGAILASLTQRALPFLLAFAGGAMILVVVSELIPESQRSRSSTAMTIATMLGFAVMMILDVAFS